MPAVFGRPATWMLSLMTSGTPASGPSALPCRRASSTALAAAMARSSLSVMTALRSAQRLDAGEGGAHQCLGGDAPGANELGGLRDGKAVEIGKFRLRECPVAGVSVSTVASSACLIDPDMGPSVAARWRQSRGLERRRHPNFRGQGRRRRGPLDDLHDSCRLPASECLPSRAKQTTR